MTEYKEKKYKTGITFGSFDPLHFGHIALFGRAKLQCEKLIVCLSTAGDIRRRKKRIERISFNERMAALLVIRTIDTVDYQGEDKNKKSLLEFYKPDVIFVGDDHKPEDFEGEGLGVPVVYLPHTPGIHSTDLVK